MQKVNYPTAAEILKPIASPQELAAAIKTAAAEVEAAEQKIKDLVAQLEAAKEERIRAGAVHYTLKMGFGLGSIIRGESNGRAVTFIVDFVCGGMYAEGRRYKVNGELGSRPEYIRGTHRGIKNVEVIKI